MFGKTLFVTSRFGALPEGMTNSLKRMAVDYVECPIWNLEEAYEKLNPQVVIFFHHFLKEWDDAIVERLSKITCHKMLWDWECPWEIDYVEKFSHSFSYVLVQDKNSAEVLKSRIGNKAIFVPHAADPASCRQESVAFDYRSDLFFCGAAYPSRLKFFREVLPHLQDYKVVLAGTGWEFLPNTASQKIINTGLGAGDYIAYANGAKVNLNLHRLSDEVPMANAAHVPASSPNNRFFELNMIGRMQLVDAVRMPEIVTYYTNDVWQFANPQHFIQMLPKAIEVGKVVGEEMRAETLEKHTYEKRFVDIIAKLI